MYEESNFFCVFLEYIFNKDKVPLSLSLSRRCKDGGKRMLMNEVDGNIHKEKETRFLSD